MNPNIRKILVGVLCIGAALAFVLAMVFLFRSDTPTTEPTPSPTVSATPVLDNPAPIGTPEPTPTETAMPEEVDGLPVGKWVVTPERRDYSDGSLTMYIPAINITRTIHNGTDAATLNKGVGLYDYAQLPGEGNRNVSLAGHRNGIDKNGKITDHAPFYYVDELKEGDYLYLYDSEHIYRYIYEKTWVIEPDDWDPIATTGYSCMTITSCTPIGVSDHRIVVRALLDEIFDYTSDFDFVAARPLEDNVS